MRKAIPVLIVGVLVFMVIIGLVVLWGERSAPQVQVTWGGPTLCVSERDYFMTRIASLLNEWSGSPFGRPRPFGPGEEDRYLVFDLEGRLIWLVRQGVADPCDCVQLPAAVSWTVYNHAEGGLDELSSPVCVKSSRRWRGTLVLVGRTSDNTHFSCEMRAPFFHADMRWEEGAFNPNSLSSSRTAENLSSVLVTDPNDVQEIMRTRPSLATYEDVTTTDEAGQDALARRKAVWRRLQKPLYQALEQQAIQRGYEPARISAQPGPDYTAGLAGIGIKPLPSGRVNRFWSFLLHRRRRSLPYLFFTIDALNDGRWHCQTTQALGMGGPSSRRDGFDFYVEQPENALDVNLPRPEPEPGTPRWSVDLDDGTRVELIGVCAHPGSTWWAPDGSALDHWPGFLGRGPQSQLRFDIMSAGSGRIRMRSMPMGFQRDEQSVAVVLHVPSTMGFGNRSGSSSSGDVSVHYGKHPPLLDRFGQSVPVQSPGQYIVLQFDPSGQGSINRVLGIRVGDAQSRPKIIRQTRARSPGIARSVVGGVAGSGGVGGPRVPIPPDAMAQPEPDSDLPLQWILFKNISLHPDQHTEFEMGITEDAGGIASTKVQIRL